MDHFKTFVLLAGIGLVVGLGRALDTEHPLSARMIAGRAIVSAGLGAAAGLILLHAPTIPPLALYGAAAAISSVGVSLLERLVTHYLPKSKSDE